jgi:hypothetical protein
MLTRIGKELKHDSTNKFTYAKRRLRNYKVDERLADIGVKVYCRGGRLQAGYFMSPMQKARHDKDGMRVIGHYKAQPWETWTEKKKPSFNSKFM